jgi:hypothetical protein
MINDNIPPAIRARRAVHDFAEDKPEHVRNLAWVIRAQLCVLGRNDSPALRAIVAQNLERLATE